MPETDCSLITCGVLIRDWCIENDPYQTEMDVSAAPPVIPQAHPPIAFTCPHGTTWYVFPTTEQIAKWTREGVA